MLALLDFQFDFICLTETKLQYSKEPLIDINIDGYQNPVGTPTESTKGGVLIYAKKGSNFEKVPSIIRNQIDLMSTY